MATRADALVIMAKAPVAGRAKTRLVPPLSPEQAAELSRCLLLDLLENLQSFGAGDRFVAFSPADAAPLFAETVPSAFACFAQRGLDLGERMNFVFEDLFARGYRNIVVLGSDLPLFPLCFLEEGFEELNGSAGRVVLGPSRDGGYYLIGMNRPVPEIFKDMAWSSSGVLAATAQKLARLGIDPHLLPPWFDIDTVEDLRHLQSIARQSPSGGQERTLRCLMTLDSKKKFA